MKKKGKAMRKASGKNYQTFIIVFVILFAVFMTSKLWMPDTSALDNTPCGTRAATSDNIDAGLHSWEYNPDKNYMEAVFNIEEQQYVYSESLKYTLELYSDNSQKTLLNCSVAYSDEDTLIVRMKDLPKGWKVLSLWISDNSDDVVKKADGQTSSAAPIFNLSSSKANFRCDRRAVQMNTALSPKSEKDYAITSVLNLIAEKKQQIKTDQQGIQQNISTIGTLNQDIEKIQNEQSYETASEVAQSTTVIQDKENQIATLKKKNTDYQTDIGDCENKNQKLKLKLSDIRSGTTRKYSTQIPDLLHDDSTQSSSIASETVSMSSSNSFAASAMQNAVSSATNTASSSKESQSLSSQKPAEKGK